MRYFKYSFLLFLLVFLPACSSFKSEIKEINSIQEVAAIFEQVSQNDLFVFDMDDVLLEPIEPALQVRFQNNVELKKIVDDFVAFRKTMKNPEKDRDLFRSKMYLKYKIQPIEQTLIDNILSIQKRNIKVIALTTFYTGKFGLIDRLEEWRYKQLLSLGLDFSKSVEQQDIRFDEFQKTKYAAEYKAKKGKEPSPAVFYKGVACCSCYPKGIVLKAFLEKVGFKPAHVFFFDDRLKNVESVVEEMKKIGIKCQGFVYNAAKVNKPMDLDVDVVRFQYELMKQRSDEDYVCYAEAKEILEKQNAITKDQLKPIQQTP